MKGTPMARRFQRLALILLALVVAPAASAHYVDLNEALHSEDTLTVGIALTGQPFAFKKDGVLRGFEVEMAEAVAEAHGLALEVVRLPRAKLAAALAAGDVDVANTLAMEAGTAGIKTVPYLVIGDHLMVLRGNPFPHPRGGRPERPSRLGHVGLERGALRPRPQPGVRGSGGARRWTSTPSPTTAGPTSRSLWGTRRATSSRP